MPKPGKRTEIFQENTLSTSKESSALEKVRSLREQADKLMTEAKAEALEKAQHAVTELNELGFNYRLSEAQEETRKRSAPTRQRRDVPCPICHFKTDPPHDGRLHRSQSTKKPFTAAELKERNLARTE